MNSFPFESRNIGTVAEPQWDRAITGATERSFNKLCYTNGVFASPVNGLLVSANGGRTVKIEPGGCHIEGARAYEPSQRTITLSPSSATLPRIDRIVCRFDTAEDKRNIEIYLKEGVPATTPSPQDIIRQSNYYEIVLADIYVPKGSTEITNSNITDQRLNKSLCGLVVPAIPSEQPTEELWKQIKDSIELVNSALDETIAGNLQNQVTAVKGSVEDAETEITELDALMKATTYQITDAQLKTIFGSTATMKTILMALESRVPRFGTMVVPDLQAAQYTAPSDGMYTARLMSNASSLSLLVYFRDFTTGLDCGSGFATGGGMAVTSFPMVKGHRYGIRHNANLGNFSDQFLPLE